jgi:uncharacterized protein with PIN domain
MSAPAKRSTKSLVGISVVGLIVIAGGGFGLFSYLQWQQQRTDRQALATLTSLDQQVQAAAKQVATPPLSPAQLAAAINNGTNSSNGVQYATNISDSYYAKLAAKVQSVTTQTSPPVSNQPALKTYGQDIHTAAVDLLNLITVHKNLTDYQLQVAIDASNAQFAADTTGNERTILSQYQTQLITKDEQSFHTYQAQLPAAQQTVVADTAKLSAAAALAQKPPPRPLALS